MPIGPFGEILGTTGTLENVSEQAVAKYKSKVVAPRNPKLIKGKENEFKMKPSQYMFQMSLATEKKLANMHTMNVPRKIELLDMSETSHQKASSINIDEPMFQPFPSEMFFQNFVPFETYEIPLTLRNNDQVPRLVKVTQQDSPYFKIISPSNVGHKVGPGLPTTFVLQFTPEDKKDYYHELVCTTERERFVVPVRAIGARGILDFPDDIHFPSAPVKYLSSRTLLVRNVGDRDCKFSLSIEKPFSVNPSNGLIPVNESLQIVVEFHPMTSGDHQSELVLHYDTGEYVYIRLYGAAQDANVRLDKNSIRIENTYISMANDRTVTIHNRSDVIAHYKWTQYATQEEEQLQKIMFSSKLHDEKKTEEDRFLEECLVDPSLRDKMSILSRTFTNRQRQVEGDRLLYNDEVFKIEPVEGDIWPNSTADISIIFKPREPQTYTRTVFCDVTGRQSRLPLRIRGDGIGPSVQFSFDEIDIGNIFVNSQHIYEVVLVNKGDIDAIFSLVPSNTVFGPCFQFNPSEGIVMPDGHQAIQVTFSSAVLGDFCEEFSIQIDGSPENLKLVFKGSVIGPTFHFDLPHLKFGTVSYGFIHTKICTLQNTALVPMTFHLRVPGDGIGESICSTSEYDSNLSESGSTVPPKEFDITPSSGTLQPQSDTQIKIDLCSNTKKKKVPTATLR